MWVLAILGGLLILAASALGMVGIVGLEIFMKDIGVTVLGVLATIVAVLTSCRVLPEEISRRTLYPLLARPVRRIDLLVGKYLGSVFVSWIGFLVLGAVVSTILAAFHIPLGWIAIQYAILKCLGLAVVCAVGLGLSTVMTPAAAATMTFILAFGSAMLSRAIVLTGQSSSGAVPVCRVLESVLPQIHLFDLGGRLVYIGWSPVSFAVFGGLAAYAAIYSSFAIFGGWLAIRRKAY
jgi:ABC-type transport system involved in multi-copper enzyme maturation permease subunit